MHIFNSLTEWMNTLESTRLISSTGDVLMFDELITTVAFPHITSNHWFCCVSLPDSFPMADRNVGPRGGTGPGQMANFNRSTEDLRIKQQPAANYGRLRECQVLACEAGWCFFKIKVIIFFLVLRALWRVKAYITITVSSYNLQITHYSFTCRLLFNISAYVKTE